MIYPERFIRQETLPCVFIIKRWQSRELAKPFARYTKIARENGHKTRQLETTLHGRAVRSATHSSSLSHSLSPARYSLALRWAEPRYVVEFRLAAARAPPAISIRDMLYLYQAPPPLQVFWCRSDVKVCGDYLWQLLGIIGQSPCYRTRSCSYGELEGFVIHEMKFLDAIIWKVDSWCVLIMISSWHALRVLSTTKL